MSNELNTTEVTTLADVVNPNDGQTSLREALSNAVNGDTITFANSLIGGTVNIGSELTINKSITLNGDITGDQTADLTINGGGNSRIFNIDDGNNSSFSNVVIFGLKLINGRVTGTNGGGILNSENLSLSNSNISGNSARYGGGVFSRYGTASFSNTTISGNSAIYYGGGVVSRYGTASFSNTTISGNSAKFGGGVYSRYGTASFSNTTISGNSATLGGGVFNRYGTASFSNITISDNFAEYYGGGVYSRYGTASFSNTTISGNSAYRGGGVFGRYETASFSDTTFSSNSARYGGGVFSSSGTATFSNTTVSGNSASAGGGVFGNFETASFSNTTISGNTAYRGGGVFSRYGTASFSNTTISGNSAYRGGGVFSRYGTATFSNTTVSGNSAYSGGGLFNSSGIATFSNTTVSGNSAYSGGGVYNRGTASLRSTILSGNQNQDLSNFDTIISNGHNLVGTGDTSSFNETTDQTNITNPGLGPLANNGGPTLTHAILANSPAIDAGSNPDHLLYDQRGANFLRTKGTATDIGAFESDFQQQRFLGTLGRDNLMGTFGNDVIIGLTSRDTLTGGGGNDIFVYNRFTDAGDIITDFTLGEDLLNFNGVMQSIGFTGGNPITEGYITFLESGTNNTLVNINSDGSIGFAPPRAFILLQNVQPSALSIDNFIPFD